MVELFDEESSVIVRKYSAGISYNSRLLKQAAKQQSYKETGGFGRFDCPTVLKLYEGGLTELSWYEMEYVHAEKYSDYLERISVSHLNSTVQSLIAYLDNAKSRCKLETPNPSLFQTKLRDLHVKLESMPQLNKYIVAGVFAMLNNPPREELYIGFCHGDLTLSNILFTDEKLFLIDFLDTFIESPLQDIVKLRQDTYFGWIMVIDQDLPLHRCNKIKQIFDHIDRSIVEYISKDRVMELWYPYFQVFNLARILPYLKKDNEIMFVQDKLKTLL